MASPDAALEDEQARKRGKPSCDAVEAGALALRLFGVRAVHVSRLNSYDDANFLVDDGVALRVLKVQNARDSNLPFIEAQNAAMDVVRAHACWCPAALVALSDRRIESVTLAPDGHPREHIVRLFEYKKARLLGDVAPSPALIASVGRMLGRVTGALAGFEHPAASRSHAWDLAGFLSVVPPLLDAGALRAAADAELIRRAFAWYAALVTPLAATLRTQVAHGDMNDQNILVGEDADEAVGLLDFGDMVRTWTVADPAIACAYLVIQLHYEDRAPAMREVIDACATLLAGFTSAAPLDDDEWSVLPSLVLARIATSLVFGAYSAALDPSNGYLLLTHAPGWRALRLLLSVPLERLQEGFRQPLQG